ncbi:MAG: hypothetical protein LC127_08255 [Chitinophagales bacterium]|nr:hypothetical protein [Chitinophagales bacterium]
MSDLIINVKSTKQFVFNPNKLTIRTVSTDIPNGTAIIFYELVETSIDNTRYISRSWTDSGNVQVPLALLAGATDGQGNLNPAVINQFLTAFNLELDTNV